MSTKTSFKRIALVAASALAIAGFSAVPANAALSTTVAVVTSSSATVYGTVGTAATATISLATTTAETTGVTATDTLAITPTISSQPVGGALTVGAPASGTVGLTDPIVTGNFAATGTQNKWTNTVSAGVQSLKPHTTVGTIPAFAAAAVSTLSLTATVAGTYSIVLTPTGAVTTNTPVTVTFNIAGLAYSLGDGTAVSPAIAGNGIAGPANTVTVNATTNASNTRALVTVSGAGATINSNAGTALVAGATSTIVAAGTNAAIIINTPTAGTVTVSQFYESGNGTGIYAATASKTATITVGAAALNGTLSVANSTAVVDGTSIANAAHNNSTTVDDVVLASKSASTSAEVASIKVTLKDTLTNLMPDTTTLSAVVTGPGLLSIGSSEPSTATGRAVSATTSSGVGFVTVYADGSEGVGTITISVGTTVVATKTVTFYGTATKYAAVVKKAHIANSGSPTADVVEVTATDKGGNLVPSSTILASVGTSTTATVTASVATGATGKALFAMTGLATKFGAVVVTFSDSATAPTVTTTATVGVSSVLAKTVTAAADKASYSLGEKITWTLTFKDANGLGIPDGSYAAATLLANSAANPVASASLASTPFLGTAAVDVVAGVATATGYAPLAAGPVSYTWTLAGTAGAADTANLVTALQATTVTASAEVEGDATASLALDAANAATDAANNAYDEAQNATQAASDALAAVTALAAQVKSLIASVKKLTAAVAKLKK